MVGNPSLEPSSRLVVTAPEVLRGRVFVLDGQRMVVGRGEAAEVFLNDPRVSRAHAALERFGANILVSDLGSRGGTTVNGHPIRDRQALCDGDVLGFASVEARYESPAGRADETVIAPAAAGGRQSGWQRGSPPAPSPSRDVRFDVGRQQDGRFNNVAGDQYNQYVQQIRQERASFLEEIAGARTRATRIVILGFLLILVGYGVYFWVFSKTASSFDDIFSSSENQDPDFSPDLPRVFGPEVGGVPLALIAFAVATLGEVLLVVGIVLHIIAAARRRRRESEFAAVIQPPPPHTHQNSPPPYMRQNRYQNRWEP
jgi:hypothetical protein